MLFTAGSRATRTVVRLAPPSQTSTGTVRLSARPSARVITSGTGMGARPRFSMPISTESPTVATLSIAWSRRQVSKNQVRQNHYRSRPDTSSKVSKKS